MDAQTRRSRRRLRWLVAGGTFAIAAVLAGLGHVGLSGMTLIDDAREVEEAFLRKTIDRRTGAPPSRAVIADERSVLERLDRDTDAATVAAKVRLRAAAGAALALYVLVGWWLWRASSARLETEEAAHRQDQRFRLLIENSADVFAILSPSGVNLYTSPSVERVLGLTPAEVVGTNGFNLMHPDDVTRLAPVLMMLAPDAVERAEFRFRHRDGRWVWVEGFVQNKLLDPAIGGIVSTYRDISERKRSEEALRHQEVRFRMMVENSQDIIAVLDRDGRAQFGSTAMAGVLGWDPRELPGRATFDLIHPEDRPAIESALRELAGEPGATRPLACRMQHRDGGWRHMEGVGKNLLDNPAIRGIVLWYHDVTDRKRGEEALRVAEAQFREAQKMEAVGRLAGGVAHDFNNILTVINGFSELALGKLPEDHPVYARVGDILKAGQRAAGLTRQLLTFSRRRESQVVPVDVGAAIAETESMLRRLIGEDVDLSTRLAPDLPRVLIDPTQLQQIVMNLAVNARDAMPSGGSLTIATESIEIGEGPGVRLTVRDTGTGMPPEVIAKIFEPFFTTKEVGKGTGLGLSIVYGNVKGAGGTVGVESTPGRGTTFIVDLPARAATPAGPAAETGGGTADRGLESVLVVEDEVELRGLVQEVLEHHGYTVTAVGDGAAAVAAAERPGARFDLVLSDVVMPGMPSDEMVLRLWQVQPRAKLLFMSGYAERAAIHPLLANGAVPFLEKPFAPSALARKVRAVLDAPVAVEPV